MPSDVSLAEVLREPGVNARPLCVAFDGTVITTRILSERMALLFRQRPWATLALPFWVLGGRDALRKRLANVTSLDAKTLPYRAPLITALRESRETGRHIVLASTTELDIAQHVFDYLGVFDEICSAEGRSKAKPQNLREALQAAYPAGFDFIGQSQSDLPLLEAATRGYLVGASPAAIAAARQVKP